MIFIDTQKGFSYTFVIKKGLLVDQYQFNFLYFQKGTSYQHQ